MVTTRSRRSIGFAAGVLAIAAGVGVAAPPAGAIAPGCTAAQPTSVGGPIYAHTGQYDHYLVQAQVGIDLVNAAGQKVKADGTVITPSNPGAGGYSAIDKVNPTLGQPGAPDGTPGAETSWGADGTTAPLCVSNLVKQAWIETYPKNGNNVTDKTYYGESMDHGMQLTSSVANTIAVRIPTRNDYGGNTGDINGYITKNGHVVDNSSINAIRVWSTDGGAACGTQGFSASADQLGPSGTQDATYYRVEAMAGGQCHAPYQTYRVRVTVDGVTQEKSANVANGARPRVDFAF